MKFIVSLNFSDGCTWSATEYVSVECNHQEELYSNLVDAIIDYAKFKNGDAYSWSDQSRYATICGSSFDLDAFVYLTEHGKKDNHWVILDPSIMTLDEWFEEHKNMEWGI